MKYRIGIVLALAAGEILSLGVSKLIVFNAINLIIVLLAWYITKRHLWTIDYFNTFLALQVSIFMTIKHF
jgi:hypothetical protein